MSFGSSIDMAADVGTQIIAPYNGEVVSVYYGSTKTSDSSDRINYGPQGLGNIVNVIRHYGPDGEFNAHILI